MEKILEIKKLNIEYKNLKNANQLPTKAVKDVSFSIKKGEIYSLAGESGCGKSSIAKAIMRLLTPVSGEILYEGENIFKLSKENRLLYPTKVQMVFQNPYSSLNPKMKIADILKEPLDINTKYSKNHKLAIIKDVLNEVGLDNNALSLYPHQFSGGQRQRIAIARALILNPSLLIADEPVSALDASIQAQIINLLKDLKVKRNLTILFISHDLSVIKYLSDRVGIMYLGELLEENITSSIFNFPHAEYTRKLLAAAPTISL